MPWKRGRSSGITRAVNAVERFFAASRAGDVDAAVEQLAADVVMLNPATLRGVDLIELDETDRISSFIVAVRPVGALMALGARYVRIPAALTSSPVHVRTRMGRSKLPLESHAFRGQRHGGPGCGDNRLANT